MHMPVNPLAEREYEPRRHGHKWACRTNTASAASFNAGVAQSLPCLPAKEKRADAALSCLRFMDAASAASVNPILDVIHH
jgi:hypothetical protein